MIEIGASTKGVSAVEVKDSSRSAKSAQPQPDGEASGLESVVKVNAEVTDKAVAENANIDKVVAEMNEFIQKEQRDLHFSIDEGTGDTVVQVRDRSSGDLIRQIPGDVFLDLARSVKDNEPIQLINARG